MIYLDDKYPDVLVSNGKLLVDEVNVEDDVTFKASFVVTGSISCNGKVTGLFDLIVLGNITAAELDVKGKLVCLGNCLVEQTIVVQNEISAHELKAASITCREQIVADNVTVESIFSDSNIIVSRVLTIEERAETALNILCGDTMFGSGSISANCVVTAEPLDMDDNIEIEAPPCMYKPTTQPSVQVSTTSSVRYALNNDFEGYINELSQASNESQQLVLKKYLKTLTESRKAADSHFRGCNDIAILISLLDISTSPLFNGWEIVQSWIRELLDYYSELIIEKSFDVSSLKPIPDLREGIYVWHDHYKKGVVTKTFMIAAKKYAEIDFEECGKKKFSVYDNLGVFKKICDVADYGAFDGKQLLKCNISNYSEWLFALSTIENNKALLGNSLYNAIYEKLIAIIGLKPKYLADRFDMKG